MSRPFVHLHNHTEYSLLDGANRIPELVARCKELGMDSMAISDHGVMFGVMEFHMECVKQGIRPIIGMEAYVAPNGYLKKSGREENETYHLLLLAKDLDGYRNLCQLATIAALEGYYYKPRIDHELLKKYSKGLIGTTTCLGSEVNQFLLEGNYEKAQYTAGMYSEIFGAGNYFVELQDHRLDEQRQIREGLLRISKELKLPLIATNDAHYLCKTDAVPHDVLLCIQTGKQVDDPNRMRFATDEFYIKSPEEMGELFHENLDAVENTAMVAAMCDVPLGKQKANMPDPELPEGFTPMEYLRHLSLENLPKKVKNADENALKRLNYELEVIETTGFSSYFLLVREFAQFTRSQGIYFGVRGSAAASLVSYCIDITDVDPLEYDLTFERFLNIERISMPDIDMDFEDARRDEVIKYVTQKYGQDHVAQIVTFGTLGAKAAIKDCGRVQGYTPQETDRICKTIPTVPGMTIKKALKEVVEFKQMYENEPRVRELVEVARSVEGVSRHTGVHAAGVVIAKEPLVEHIPLYKGNDGQAITAFEMGILEKIGLLKMDFLGLSNLTVLARAIDYIRPVLTDPSHPLSSGSVWDLPLDDEASYDLLARGQTVGVFQLESAGMTRYVKELRPASVRELAAMVALYRPGPLDHIPDFIDNKFGRKTPEFLDERMIPILEETYGIIVYQDQVLKLVQALAGFSLGKADILRRAMGKKDEKAMASMKIEFVEGCAANGISKEVADKVWVKLEPFAGYAFNKAHAVCYAMIAYQTAYLKANFPVQYMAALMGVYRDKEDRVVACIEECRRLKIQVLPPDVNASLKEFSVEAGTSSASPSAIRFGLAAIKGVGEAMVQELIREREENGLFTHLFEFAERMKAFGLNRTALEALIKSGALDSIDRNRRKLLEMVDSALIFADTQTKNRLSGQNSLFGEGDPSTPNYPTLPEYEAFGRSEILSMEKEVMGIYVSDHPLRGYERALSTVVSHSCGSVAELEEGKSVRLAGVIAALKTQITKQSGKKMATMVLEDFSGQVSITVFPAVYEKLQSHLQKDTVVKATGVVMHRERPGSGGEKSVEIRLEDVSPFDQPQLEIGPASDNRLTIKIPRATRPQLRALIDTLKRYPGTYESFLQILPSDSHLPLYTGYSTDATLESLRAIQDVLPNCEIETSGLTSQYDEDAPIAEAPLVG